MLCRQCSGLKLKAFGLLCEIRLASLNFNPCDCLQGILRTNTANNTLTAELIRSKFKSSVMYCDESFL